MDGANIILGYVEDSGGLVILDEVGIGWNHFQDTERGGDDDISDASGSTQAGRTILEFVYPLASGDARDHSFRTNKTYGFFLGYHETAKDNAAIHTARSGSIDLFVEPAPQAPTDTDKSGLDVFCYAIVSVAVLILAGFVAWYFRRPEIVRFSRADGWPLK
jgi:hypothetical protein